MYLCTRVIDPDDDVDESNENNNRSTCQYTIQGEEEIGAPSNFEFSVSNENQINLSWQDNSNNEERFRLERAFNNTGWEWNSRFYIARNEESIFQNARSAGDHRIYSGRYAYRIRAENQNGTNFSDWVPLPEYIYMYPNAPTNFELEWAAPNQVDLSWSDNSAFENHFRIERKVNSGSRIERWDRIGADEEYIFDRDIIEATYRYWIRAEDESGEYNSNWVEERIVVFDVEEEIKQILPKNFSLNQIYPNPFNAVTNISYALPIPSKVTLGIYNTTGGLVSTLLNSQLPQGQHTLIWNAESINAGIYFVKIDANQYSDVQKVILLK